MSDSDAVRREDKQRTLCRMTKCGAFGAGFVVCYRYYRDQLGCFGTHERGACTNKLMISRTEVEKHMLTALREKLLRKDFFEEFCPLMA